MGKEIGWTEPVFLIGQPRTQKVAGFHYLFVEEMEYWGMPYGNLTFTSIAPTWRWMSTA